MPTPPCASSSPKAATTGTSLNANRIVNTKVILSGLRRVATDDLERVRFPVGKDRRRPAGPKRETYSAPRASTSPRTICAKLFRPAPDRLVHLEQDRTESLSGNGAAASAALRHVEFRRSFGRSAYLDVCGALFRCNAMMGMIEDEIEAAARRLCGRRL